MSHCTPGESSYVSIEHEEINDDDNKTYGDTLENSRKYYENAENSELSSSDLSLLDDYDETEKRAPGGIVPLGVRADKGKGPLASAAASIKEMDEALHDLEKWKNNHESKLRHMKSKYETQFNDIYSSETRDENNTTAPTISNEGNKDFDEEERQVRAILRKLSESSESRNFQTEITNHHSLTDAELHLLTSSDLTRKDSPRLVSQNSEEAAFETSSSDFRDDIIPAQDETELQLDGIEDNIVEWNAQMDSILAKMDSLSA